MRRVFYAIVFVAVLGALCLGCDPSDNRLFILNKTNNQINYYCYDLNDTLDIDKFYYRYGDWLDSLTAWELDSSRIENLKPNNLENIALTSMRWEAIEYHSPNKKINIFFVERDTMVKYSWREIMMLRKYKRGSYTVDYLKERNWKLSYPDDMTDMEGR